MEGTRGWLSGQPTWRLGCPGESCLWPGWSMGWVWFFWSPAWWRYRYLLLGGYPSLHQAPSPAARSLGHMTGSDWWAASTECHPSQRARGWFPPHPQRSSPSSVIADRTVEPPHGGWLPGDGLRIGTEGKYNWPCVGRRWVRYELSLTQVHPAEWAWGSKIPQSLKSTVFLMWCYLLNWHCDTQNNLLNWIRHKDFSPTEKEAEANDMSEGLIPKSVIPSWAEIQWK